MGNQPTNMYPGYLRNDIEQIFISRLIKYELIEYTVSFDGMAF